MDDQEIIQDFLIESNQNLSRVEQEVLALEQRPKDQQVLGSIFRTFHTVKGTCGFLGFGKLETITHQAENLLGEVRDGRRDFTPAIASLILQTLDAVQQELMAIESTGRESESPHAGLLSNLNQMLSAAVEKAAPPAAEPPAEEPGEGAKSSALADSSIRVDTKLVDRLINLVGELVLVRNQVLQNGVASASGDDKAIAHRLNLITTELQEGVMRSRMQPVGTIWNKLPRLVRDTAAQLKKEIVLITDGADKEMDRTILEAIKDPLTHILRNSCDHGLETPAERFAAGKPPQGVVSLRAYHEGSQVVLEIEDDGRGIDPVKLRSKAVEKGLLSLAAANALSDRDAIHLVFHAGFSTAEKVTNISGRGVGMDVVKKNIQSIGGQVEIQSRVGVGTTVKIRIPLTLAIIPGLIVTSGGQTFVVPQAHLVELVRLQGERPAAMESTPEGSILRWRGTLIPLVELNQALRLATGPSVVSVRNIAIVEAEGAVFGLVLDRILATREIVVKPLGRQLKRLTWYAGATILGDGSVALILDIPGLARRENIAARGEATAQTDETGTPAAAMQQFLLFSCGRYNRLAIPLALVDRLEKFPADRLERTADSRVVQYRDSLLRVSALGQLLGAGGEECFQGTHVQVIVVRRGDAAIGLAVDRIIDVQRGTVAAPTPTSTAGLLATFVLNGTATEMVDLPRLLAGTRPRWDQPPWPSAPSGHPVLVSAESQFRAKALRHYLELGGFPAELCAGGVAAVANLERSRDFRAVIVDWPEAPDAGWADSLQKLSQAAGIPVIGVSEAGPPETPEWILGCCPPDDFQALLRLMESANVSEQPVETGAGL